jgi:peptidyl-tRNA hydrolase, PTH1 family
MYYIVALGNPGDEYTYTRHNIAWLVIDEVMKRANTETANYSKLYLGKIAKGKISNQLVSYLFPGTFMNMSGNAVKKLITQEEISKLIVVHDDIALPLGEVKISFDKGSGGQNGVQSIIDMLGTKKFIRIRIGIARRHFLTGAIIRPESSTLASFVLSRMTTQELHTVSIVAQTVEQMLVTIVNEGYLMAMNKYNN